MYELLNNWKVVLLSLGGAATFWFFNALNKDYNAVITYPVEFQFERDSVVIMKPLPTDVTIDVSSGGWNLIRSTLFFNVTPIQIELENPTEISYFTRSSLFPFVVDQLDELEVNYLVTDTLHINIERKVSRIIGLKLDSLKLSLEEGYRLTSPIRIHPDTVKLTGPKSFIDTLGTTYFLTLKEEGIDDPIEQDIEVPVPKKLAAAFPNEVHLAFRVEKFERITMRVDVEAVNFPADSSIYLSQGFVDIAFTIPSSKNEDFRPSDFAVTADRSMLHRRDSTVMAMLMYYPEHAIEVLVEPEHIPVSYGK